MTGNRFVTRGFVFATLALAVVIASQFYLSSPYLPWVVLFLGAATVIFILSLRSQTGPEITLTPFSIMHETSIAPVKRNRIMKPGLPDFGRINFGHVFAIIAALPRSIFSWIGQNRLIVGMFVLPVGIAGEYLLLSGQLVNGALCMLIAMLVFTAAVGRQPGPATPSNSEPLNWRSFFPSSSNETGYALGLAILCAVAAFFLFGAPFPAFIPWLLHFASVGLLIYSGVRLAKKAEPENQQKTVNKWSWLEIVLLLLVMIIAAGMRLYHLDQLPYGLWYDEANNGLQAQRILSEPGYLPVFETSTQLPAHFLYFLALSLRLLGTTAFSVRIVSALFGIATVAAAFFTGQELFNRKLGLVLAFFLAISRWDINWSRIGMHGVTVPFFEILTIGLLLRALRKQRLLDYSLAGLSLGFGLCFYPPLLLFPLVVFIFLSFLWLRKPASLRSLWPGMLVLLLGIFIASVPVSQFAIYQPHDFFARMGATSIFQDKSLQEAWKAVSKTTVDHLLMFNYRGDFNGRHNLAGAPMLDPITGALLVIGVGLSLWRIRQPGSFLLISWLLIMLVPAIFSLDFESPQSYRAIGSLPAVYLLALIPIHALWQEWEQSTVRLPVAIFAIPLSLLLIAAGAFNYNTYFNLQANNAATWSAFSTPDTIVGKVMAQLGPQEEYYVSVLFYDSPTIRFLAPGAANNHPLEVYTTLPLITGNGKAVAFFVDGDRKPFYLQAKHYYPNADFKEYQSPDGTTILYQIILKPSDIESARGIHTSYYRDANFSEPALLSRKETGIAVDWKDGSPARFPAWVKWQGLLYTEKFGSYRFLLHSPGTAELILDGVQVPMTGQPDQTAEIELAKGVHEIIIKTQAQTGHFELDWQPPDGQMSPVPVDNLFVPPVSNNGLLGKYYANGDWQGPPAFTQIDPWIHFYYHNQPLLRPYTVEWTGRINITTAGEYRFGLESIDESRLFIDDNLIVDGTTNNQYQESTISLTPGFHTIRLLYADRTGYTHINLYWTPPGSQMEPIPQEVLFLP